MSTEPKPLPDKIWRISQHDRVREMMWLSDESTASYWDGQGHVVTEHRLETPQMREAFDAMREACKSAELQILYLHEKFTETGSGNQVLEQIRAALAKALDSEK